MKSQMFSALMAGMKEADDKLHNSDLDQVMMITAFCSYAIMLISLTAQELDEDLYKDIATRLSDLNTYVRTNLTSVMTRFPNKKSGDFALVFNPDINVQWDIVPMSEISVRNPVQ